MKAVKILGMVLAGYIGLVVAFESLIGFFQPEADTTLVLTSFEGDGTRHDRVVTKLESDGKLYVAANHWPRAWYHRVLENPEVEVTQGGASAPYTAVGVSGAEHDRVGSDQPLPFVFKILTGFPPRLFVRLDPR